MGPGGTVELADRTEQGSRQRPDLPRPCLCVRPLGSCPVADTQGTLSPCRPLPTASHWLLASLTESCTWWGLKGGFRRKSRGSRRLRTRAPVLSVVCLDGIKDDSLSPATQDIWPGVTGGEGSAPPASCCLGPVKGYRAALVLARKTPGQQQIWRPTPTGVPVPLPHSTGLCS